MNFLFQTVVSGIDDMFFFIRLDNVEILPSIKIECQKKKSSVWLVLKTDTKLLDILCCALVLHALLN